MLPAREFNYSLHGDAAGRRIGKTLMDTWGFTVRHYLICVKARSSPCNAFNPRFQKYKIGMLILVKLLTLTAIILLHYFDTFFSFLRVH